MKLQIGQRYSLCVLTEHMCVWAFFSIDDILYCYWWMASQFGRKPIKRTCDFAGTRERRIWLPNSDRMNQSESLHGCRQLLVSIERSTFEIRQMTKWGTHTVSHLSNGRKRGRNCSRPHRLLFTLWQTYGRRWVTTIRRYILLNRFSWRRRRRRVQKQQGSRYDINEIFRIRMALNRRV